MKKWMGWLIPGALLAGALLMAGCFTSPTDPHAGAFTGVNSSNGGDHHGGVPTVVVPTVPTGPTATPTGPTATPTPPAGSGSISGNITGSGGGVVEIQAVGLGGLTHYTATRTGDGAYSITGVADGMYGVVADTISGSPARSGSFSGPPTPPLIISGGTAYTGIDIAMH